MASYNQVTLMGNLTRDPEKRYTDSGTCVVSLSLAVNRRVKKNNEWTDEVSFFDITVWGAQGENCAKFLAKGRPVLIDGELRQRRWEATDGSKRSKVEVVANRVVFVGSPRASEDREGVADDEAPPPIEDDDVPF